MASGTREPRVIPILTCKDNGKVQVHEDALQEIFLHPNLQDKPVCICSISGAFRKGKSFMLNFFIRYLRNKGHCNKSWMGAADTPMADGFVWRGGMKGCTSGILVWSEIFTVEREDGEVAVILMDTQGLFENKVGQKTNSIIFALSTLISSVQIFNLTQQIQESDLELLQFFTAYAKAAHEAPGDVKTEPFQTLVFLVRDWPHAVETEYGTAGGVKYLNEVLSNESTTEELSSVRNYLRSSFKDTRCCLLPHPGLRVSETSHSFKGCLTDIHKDFLLQTALFVESLLDPKNLVVKAINGRVMSAPAILQYVFDCGKSLTDGKLPGPKTMMKNVAEAQNFDSQRRCREKYIENMNEVIGESFIDSNVLQRQHKQASSSAMNEYAEMTRFGDEESRGKYREYLNEEILRHYGILVRANQSKKATSESNLMKFIRRTADQHEEKMKAAISYQKFLSDQELDRLCARLETESYEAYKQACTDTQQRDENFPKLRDTLERIHRAIREENNHKRRIAEEQDELSRLMMKLELEYVKQYRDEMCEHTKHYMDEERLKQTADRRRREILDSFKLRAVDHEAMPDSSTIQDHYASLEAKLDEEYERILQNNDGNKRVLEKDLESHRLKAILDYENEFKTLLKDTYMDETDLIQKHRDVVEEHMSKLRSAYGNNSKIPVVDRHLVETEKELSEMHAKIEQWNKKHNKFLRRCFKFFKFFKTMNEMLGIIGDIKEVKIE